MPEKTSLKKKVLLKSGQELFEKYGYKKVSIDEIVKKAGVAKGTFYLYFSNKDDLYKTIFSQFFVFGEKMKDHLMKLPDLRTITYEKFIGMLYILSNNRILREVLLKNPNYQSPSVNFEHIIKYNAKQRDQKEFQHLLKQVRQDIEINDLMLIGTFILSILVEYEKISKKHFWSFAEKFCKIYIDGLLSQENWQARKAKDIIKDWKKQFNI